MNPNNDRLARVKGKLFNKSFYKFLFSFIAVIAGVLLFILVVGGVSGIE